MRRRAWAAAALLAACAAGRVETLYRGPAPALTRVAVAGISGPGPLGGDAAARALAAALARSIEAVAAADADTVVGGGLDMPRASAAVLAELRRATGAEAVVFGTVSPRGERLELSVVDARTGELLLRARARPRGAAFASVEEAGAAGAAALAPLARGRGGEPTAPEPDELPPP